jgi:hypothetical protein
MSASETILERWVAVTLQSYPAQALPFIAGERDPFRNPIGHTLHLSLATLLQELLGAMDENVLAPALDSIVRLRAVQNFSASEAVRFVFELKRILRDTSPASAELLEYRIDVLALLAFDQYTACREQIAGLRARDQQLRARCGTS